MGAKAAEIFLCELEPGVFWRSTTNLLRRIYKGKRLPATTWLRASRKQDWKNLGVQKKRIEKYGCKISWKFSLWAWAGSVLKIYYESTTDLRMEEAACNNMTESVVRTGLKKSMVQKQWEDFLVMLSLEWSVDLQRIYYAFTKERGFLSLCVEVADTYV